MQKLATDDFPGFAPHRPRRTAFLWMAILLVLGSTCFVLFLGPVLLAMALLRMLDGLPTWFGGFLVTIMTLADLRVLLPLLELLSLLVSGEPVQFVMRLVQMLSGN